MNTSTKTTAGTTRIYRLKVQGYCNYTDTDLLKLTFGNRFAYVVCSSFLAIGVITANIPILSALMIIAFLGIVLPYHPFDYIYNHVIRKNLNKPELPPRSRQVKFACLIATAWMAATIYLFYSGFDIAGYIAGALLFSVAFLVSTTDICIPSMIYNFLFRYKVE
ncbi:MAG: DUF4395 domain-containing protein [Bacteroidales bacterium]|nr:DUF4395 domain-containing protein [Bacteroidales bacterium]